MGEKEESLEQILIDEEEAKKEFLEELRTKNLEETRTFERAALERALLEKAAEEERLKEKQKALVEVASSIHEEKQEEDKENKDNDETQLVISGETQLAKVEKKTNKEILNILKATLIDTTVTAVASIVAVYLFDALLRLILGYYVADFKGVYIILFLIILVLYPVLMRKLKSGKTLGQKFSKLEVKEREE